MRIKFHGACQEVGRSCIEIISDKNTKVLLDAGIKFSSEGNQYPVDLNYLSEIDGILISHAHLDHSGALPYFDHHGLQCPVYMTAATRAISKILWEDAFKIGKLKHEDLGYYKEDISKAINIIKNVKQKEEGKILDIEFKFQNAGHIPGSSAISLECDDKKILYTGDFRASDTRLLKGAGYDFSEYDILISDSTYSDRDHPDRKAEERKFLKHIRNTLSNGGSVLIPSFAIGRAQEIMMILAQENFKVPIYMDGMAVRATRDILKYPQSLKEPKRAKNVFNKIKIVKDRHQRRKIAQRQSIIITTSGMLTGGPILDHLKYYVHDPLSSILLTGWQGPDTNGRLLVEEGYVYLDGMRTKVACDYANYDFSAHMGLTEIKKLAKKINPKHWFLVHGDAEAMEVLLEWVQNMEFNVYAPELGEEVKID